ncbi:phosphoglucan phosphatase chloroplastic [Chlorella sorokiniana]|uniref:Phosphoglucan phosphatase chloroplastic n=1 Tax=Chlorella sorokiniana TaxID=3076 RepID=A0A2P6TC13_CHLSO|nr:phosphoglucan phosphatase chloroplastic [Chlorella sorokiniana]|eukprot:PRW20171.1 phosphoglucan phosphatase chloroplastic [Chlorella sorokiniana]
MPSALAVAPAAAAAGLAARPSSLQQRRPRSAATRTPPLRVSASAGHAGSAVSTLPPPAHAATPALRRSPSAEELVLQYNKDMAERMGWTNLDNPYEYHFDRPIYYHYITPDVIVGSQPRHALDVDQLAAEGVNVILSLQQDKDLAYWKVDLGEISSRADQLGMRLVRTPAVDFSPHSLRDTLPRAVRALEESRAAGGKVYVHCTAGLGRSPAVAIAALYWLTPMQLDEAYEFLTGIRPCGPSKDAIRGATYDLLSGRPREHFDHEPPHAFATLSEHDRNNIRAKLGLARG